MSVSSSLPRLSRLAAASFDVAAGAKDGKAETASRVLPVKPPSLLETKALDLFLEVVERDILRRVSGEDEVKSRPVTNRLPKPLFGIGPTILNKVAQCLGIPPQIFHEACDSSGRYL